MESGKNDSRIKNIAPYSLMTKSIAYSLNYHSQWKVNHL